MYMCTCIVSTISIVMVKTKTWNVCMEQLFVTVKLFHNKWYKTESHAVSLDDIKWRWEN